MNTETNQRHILEMCAKACGIAGEYHSLGIYPKGGPYAYWNPLADTIMGRSQCAVMCAELGIEVEWGPRGVGCNTSRFDYGATVSNHPTKTVAWQAAACAVAAAIGKEM